MREIELLNLPVLAEGGEGIIYEDKNRLAKVYKPHIDLKKKEKKVMYFLNKINSSLPMEVVVPIGTVLDNDHNFVGYLMNRIDGEDFKKLSNKNFVQSNKITTKDILSMLLKIKSVLDVLHKNNIYVGDLNDQNILFDELFNIHFIDCDSWSVDGINCEVAMDLFKDPFLKQDQFNAETDTYAFAILAWKSLTRIHPFAGVMKPDMDILERMQRGISIIDNPSVKIPRTIKSWRNLSPALIDRFKSIFENKTREFGDELEDMFQNLTFCKTEKDYYYSKYNTCPVCDTKARLLVKPVSQGVASGLNLIPKLDASKVSTIIDLHTYIDIADQIVSMKYNKKCPYQKHVKFYFTNNAIIRDYGAFIDINVNKGGKYNINKKLRSNVVAIDDDIYYITNKGTLTKSTILPQGNSMEKIASCANTAYFDVVDGHFCILNLYDDKLIVNIDGYIKSISYNEGITEYGIHYDTKLDRWLVVIESKKSANKFISYIFEKNEIKWEDDRIKYQCQLSNLCFSNSTIFIPIDDKIRGYAYAKDAFKDFECSVCSTDSKLLRQGKGFVIINNENIYTLTP